MPETLKNSILVFICVMFFVIYCNCATAGNYIVVFKDSVLETQKAKIIEDFKGIIIKDLEIINAKVVTIPDDKIADLRKNSEILRVTPDDFIKLDAPINPKILGQSPQSVPWGVERIGAKSLGKVVNRQVKVAVLDTGIDLNHPDLRDNIAGGINITDPSKPPMDFNGHGTIMAGIIGGFNKDKEFLGVAPRASLYAVQVFREVNNSQPIALYSDIIAGLEWCLKNGIQVINIGFGGYVDDPNIREAIDKVYKSGVMMSAPAGNGKTSKPFYPAALLGVYSVSAIDDRDRIAGWSNFGQHIDFCAPGVDVPSTFLDGKYIVVSGTDVASAHVAGTLALAIAGEIPPQKVNDILVDKVEDLGDRGKDDLYGYGLIDAKRTCYSAWWINPTVVKASALPHTGILPLTVELSVTIKGGPPANPVLYKWDFEGDNINDYSNVVSPNTKHIYTHPGVYKATVQVTDFLGKIATDYVVITVIQPFSVEACVSPSKAHTPQTFSFSAKVNGITKIVSYAWDFESDGKFDYESPTSPDTTYKYPTDGVYNATIVVKDIFGNPASDTVPVDVVPPIEVELTADPMEAKVNENVEFTATATGGSSPPIIYEWDFGDGQTAQTTINKVTHKYSSPKTYTATVTVTDDLGGEGGTASDSVDVVVITPFTVDLTVDKTRVHVFTIINFTAIPDKGTPPITYQWDFNNDGIFEQYSGIVPSVPHDFDNPGLYRVTVKATDSLGFQSTDFVNVEVFPPLAVTLSANPPQTYTFKDVTFTASPSGGIPPITYEWDLNNDGIYEQSSGTSPSVQKQFADGGNYKVNVRATDSVGGTKGIAVASTNVMIVQAIKVELNVNPKWVHTGDDVTFEATASYAISAVNYFWDFDGDNYFEETSGTNNIIVHRYQEGGKYIPQVKAVDDLGFAIASTRVVVAPPLSIDLMVHPKIVDTGIAVTFEVPTDGGLKEVFEGTLPIDYEWDFDSDGVIDASTYHYFDDPEIVPYYNYIYRKGGTYTCTVKAKDQIDGPKGTATDSVQVIVKEPLRVVLWESAAANRVNEEFTFTAETTGGVPPFTFEWNLDGLPGYEYSSGSVPMAKYTYTRAGRYWPEVKVTDSLGESAIDNVYLDITAAMELMITNPKANAKLHSDCKVYIGAYAKNAFTPVKYEYDFDGDGVFDWSQSGTDFISTYYTYTVPGNYNLTVRATDAKGGTSGTSTATIPIEVIPPLAVSITAKPSEGIIPIEILFTTQLQNVIGTPRIQWDLDGNGTFETSTGSIPNVKRTYTTIGIRKVSVSVGDDLYCTASVASTYINVYDAPTEYTYMTKWGRCSQYFSDFGNPFGLTVDQKGYVYVTDIDKKFVQRYGPQGTSTAVWRDAELIKGPMDIAVDSQGRIFVLDGGVLIYNYKGEFIKKWDSAGISIFIDKSDKVYIGSTQEPIVSKYDIDGNLISSWGKFGTADGQVQYATGIAVDNAGNVYVADSPTGRVQKFDKDGNFIKKFGEGDEEYGNPFDVTLDKEGTVFVSYDFGVKVFDPNGNLITKFGGKGSDNGKINEGRGIAVDDLGYVYVVDKGNCRIQKFRKGPVVLPPLTVKAKADRANVKVGEHINFTADYTGTPVNFKWVFAQGEDTKIESNNKVVPDFRYEPINSCYEIKATLTITDDFGREASDAITIPVINEKPFKFVKKWGSWGTDDGQFQGLAGIAVDKFGNVYVADTGNNRIQKFDADGNFLMKWGSYGFGPGQFSRPTSITIDNEGNIYVSDNFRVQKFDPNANYIREWNFSNGMVRSVAVDKQNGNMYIIFFGYEKHYVKKYDKHGNFIKEWLVNVYIYDIDIDSFGNLYFPTGGGVVKYDSDGNYIKSWGTTVTQYDYGNNSYYGLGSLGVCVDKNDYIYLSDLKYDRVLVYDVNGNFITFFGCSGKQNRQFSYLLDLAVNNGFIYVTDLGTYDDYKKTYDLRIQKFEANWQIQAAPSKKEFDKIALLPKKPDKTILMQNYPNPFNPETWIPFQLKEDSEVTIKIFDMSGRLVRKLDLGYKPAGLYANREDSAYWDGRNEFGEKVSSGIYFYMIETRNYTAIKKMTMLK